MLTAGGPSAPLGVLINQTTGARTILPARPGACSPRAMGGPWLLFGCNTSTNFLQLYSFVEGRWRLEPQASLPPLVSAEPIQVGSRWIEWREEICEQPEYVYCSSSADFQNIATGKLDRSVGRPADFRRTVPDLNSRTLSRRLCRPLEVPWAYVPGHAEYVKALGSIILYGRFGISAGTDSSGTQEVFLERCGSTLHLPLGPIDGQPVGDPTLTVGDSQVIVWQAGPQSLGEIGLPALSRRILRLPAEVDGAVQLAISQRTLYLLDQKLQLWTAVLPDGTAR